MKGKRAEYLLTDNGKTVGICSSAEISLITGIRLAAVSKYAANGWTYRGRWRFEVVK